MDSNKGIGRSSQRQVVVTEEIQTYELPKYEFLVTYVMIEYSLVVQLSVCRLSLCKLKEICYFNRLRTYHIPTTLQWRGKSLSNLFFPYTARNYLAGGIRLFEMLKLDQHVSEFLCAGHLNAAQGFFSMSYPSLSISSWCALGEVGLLHSKGQMHARMSSFFGMLSKPVHCDINVCLVLAGDVVAAHLLATRSLPYQYAECCRYPKIIHHGTQNPKQIHSCHLFISTQFTSSFNLVKILPSSLQLELTNAKHFPTLLIATLTLDTWMRKNTISLPPSEAG